MINKELWEEPWCKPVPKELWEQVADYCKDDVIATGNSAKEIFKDHDPHHLNDDPVYHPLHYQLANGLEAIDVIDSVIADDMMDAVEGYYTGQVLKYLLRWKRKNGLEDLKKARWYLDRLIHKLEEGYAKFH